MPSFCAVINCSDRYGHAENISFHKFPFRRKDLLEKWIDFAQRGPTWYPTKWSAFCSQHFTPEDFNCLNARKTLKKTAVPTIRVSELTAHIDNTKSKEPFLIMKASVPVKSIKHNGPYHHEDESDESEEVSTPLQTKNTTSGTKTNCRLCGLFSNAVVTFSTNFEIFGMIQKCFPTLNIQQDDNLPKDMCRQCLKRLESFSEFIDKVLEAQRELQKKFLIEKSNTRAAETRTLKIKQEPVVKVKQEVAEGLDSFLSDDLDMGIDECCEQEQDATDEVEQKFGFCEFPMLNTQDIINNCDIMEIINLDDPFIDIPDDDMPGALQQTNKYVIQAHQLLQAHMLIDEHNYACPAEDLKEEWQIKKYYKQEKTETYEQHEAEDINTPEVDEDFQNIFGHEEHSETAYKGVEIEDQRSTKPIVTSVSAIAESRLQFANEISAQVATTSNNKVDIVANDDLSSGKRHKDSTSKPNIVVLNESIVKSTAAFQLHACAVCQLKFFSIESLQQHVNFTHMNTHDVINLPPMVTLPSSNITHGSNEILQENVDDLIKQNTKTNDDINTNISYFKIPESYEDSSNNGMKQAQQQSSNDSYFNQQLKNFQSWQQNIKTLKLNALINSAWSQVNSVPTTESLEQDNSKTPAAYGTQIENQSTVVQTVELNCFEIEKTHLPNVCKNIALQPTCTNAEESVRSASANEHIFKTPSPIKSKTKTSALKNRFRIKTKQKTFAHKRKNKLHTAAENLQLLKQRYCLLLQKCKVLEENCHVLTVNNIRNSKKSNKQKRFSCKVCSIYFFTIYQLLNHKQKFHPIPKLHKQFSATCYGCEKYFLSKLALTNHMKYICQSLSLRCMKMQIKTFKCRSCNNISFTHWRLYRHHEIACKRKRAQAVHLQFHNMALQKRKSLQLICTICRRKFCNIKLLLQHYNKGTPCKLSSVAVDCAVKCRLCQQHFQLSSELILKHECKKTTNKKSMPPNVSNVAKKVAKKHLNDNSEFACSECLKVFPSSKNLYQHRITHTQEKRHKCNLCTRVFKRRGGLTQHMKGFHLQLKPYECEVCKHRYALKGDMQRCRHSLLQKRNGVINIENIAFGTPVDIRDGVC